MIASSTSLRWESLPPLWMVVLVIVPLVFWVVRFFYRREAGDVGRRLRLTMGLLRVLAILLILVVIWGPYTETVESEPSKRHLILAVDTSESMEFRDSYETSPSLAQKIRRVAGYPSTLRLDEKTRVGIVRDLLGRNRPFLEQLAGEFKLHVYTFDAAPAGLFEPREDETPTEAVERLLRALPRLRAKGTVTRIGTAIRDLARAFDAKNEPVAGILLFTDGRHTGGAPDPVDEARRAAEGTREGIPVFPVAMGNPATAVNIGVRRVDAPEVVLAGDEVSFTVHVHARGLENRTAELKAWVLDSKGKPERQLPIEVEPFLLPADGAPALKVAFRHTFHDHGTYDLKIGVPPIPGAGEAVEGDNYKRHVLHVAKLKMRVLLVASKPNYTYRFLKVALLRARKTIAANALLLSAESEWPQEASRGIPPVTVFPQKRSALAPYDVIILVDVDPTDERFAAGRELGRDHLLKMIASWVKQGAGLVLQAGRDEFVPGSYMDTPLMALLPVVPYARMREDQYQDIVQLGVAKRYHLTRAGREHPIMHILKDPEMVRDFWDGNDYATKYYWYAPIERTKSSATVLAVRRSGDGVVYKNPHTGEEHPIIALQSYGLGKVLWIGTDELWRMRRGVENLYYWRFWSGAIRHLATYRLLGGNKRIKIWVDRTDGRYRVGDSIGVEAKFLDKEFEPVVPPDGDYSDFTRTIKLRTPAGGEEQITLSGVGPDPQPEGLFRTRLNAGGPGTYRLIAEGDGEEEPAETTFVVEATTLEQRDPLMDMRMLNAIAAASGGRVLLPTQLLNLIKDELVPRTGRVRTGETHRSDLWDRSWVIWLFVALLALEWILRRLNLLL